MILNQVFFKNRGILNHEIISSSLQKCLPRSFTQQPHKYEMSYIRDQLSTYKGGSVKLTLDDSSGIAGVALSNPTKHNAFSGAMMCELEEVVYKLESWKNGHGVILYGEGNTFCSGGDLETVRQICDPENGDKMCFYMQKVLHRFWSLPLVSMALIEGVALGGGAELTTACDFRVMTSGARIGFVQTRMGVTTGWGGTTRLVHLLGRKQALKLLASGQTLCSSKARDIGLCDLVVPNEHESNALDHSKEWLKTYTASTPCLTQAVKHTVVGVLESSIANSLDKERAVFRSVWGGNEQLKALQRNIKH